MDIKDIDHLAELSKLEFTDEEKQNLLKEFDDLIKLADIVKNSDISGKSSITAIDMNDLREDVAKTSISPEELLQNAPVQDKNCFVVPVIVE